MQHDEHAYSKFMIQGSYMFRGQVALAEQPFNETQPDKNGTGHQYNDLKYKISGTFHFLKFWPDKWPGQKKVVRWKI